MPTFFFCANYFPRFKEFFKRSSSFRKSDVRLAIVR
jgi:hypothetical protein